MNNDGFPNVVEKGWPRKMPTIIDDEDEDEI